MISIDMANSLYDAMKGEIKFAIAYWNIHETEIRSSAHANGRPL